MLGCQKLHSGLWHINKLSISFEIIGKNENDDGMYDALKEGFESINIPINTGEDTEIMDRILTLLRHQNIQDVQLLLNYAKQKGILFLTFEFVEDLEAMGNNLEQCLQCIDEECEDSDSDGEPPSKVHKKDEESKPGSRKEKRDANTKEKKSSRKKEKKANKKLIKSNNNNSNSSNKNEKKNAKAKPKKCCYSCSRRKEKKIQ